VGYTEVSVPTRKQSEREVDPSSLSSAEAENA